MFSCVCSSSAADVSPSSSYSSVSGDAALLAAPALSHGFTPLLSSPLLAAYSLPSAPSAPSGPAAPSSVYGAPAVKVSLRTPNVPDQARVGNLPRRLSLWLSS